MSTYCGVNDRLEKCINSVLNVKVLVEAFNQERPDDYEIFANLRLTFVSSSNSHTVIIYPGNIGHIERGRCLPPLEVHHQDPQ